MKPEQSSTKENLRKGLKLIAVENPVLVSGLALAPVVVGAFTVKNAVGLCLVFAMTTIPIFLLSSLLGMIPAKIPAYMKTILCALVAGGLLIPARMLAKGIAPNLFDSLGMYFSVVAINAVWLLYAPECEKIKPQWALWKGLCQTLGFGVCVVAVAVVREFFAYGTFWGMPSAWSIKFPAISYSFAGFIVVGILAAFLRWGIDYSRRAKHLLHRQQKRWEEGK